MGWIVQIGLWILGLFLKKEPPVAQEAKEAGTAEVKAAVDAKAAVVEKSVAQAAVDAPATVSATETSLDKGEF